MAYKKIIKEVHTFSDLLRAEYGEKGKEERDVFEAEAKAFYLCEMIKEERKKAKVSQKELAARIDVKPSFISRIENGKVDIQLSTFLKILYGLGLDIAIIQTITP